MTGKKKTNGDPKKSITVSEAGRLGGFATVQKHGAEHYRRIGARGGAATVQKHGKDHFSKAGKIGGAATVERHGRKHFEAIGRKGGAAIAALVAQGKEARKEDPGENA